METLRVAGHDFRQVRVQGPEVWPTIKRLKRENRFKRIYLQREGGHVIRGIPLDHRPASDLGDLGGAAAPYVLIVEENGDGRAAP